jgi:hypothetical protein
MNTNSKPFPSRREFLKASAVVGTALAAPAILPGNLFAKANSDTLRVGLIGCGGRGSGAADQALKADNNVILTAMGDAFEDQLHKSLNSLQQAQPDKVKVTPDKCFVGLDAYQKVIDSGVDVVLTHNATWVPPSPSPSGDRSRQTCFLRKANGDRCPGCSFRI